MAGAAPSAKPAPFLRPLDVLDRGVLLAESALSVVIVMVMVLVAMAESASRLLHVTHPALRGAGDILMNGTLWAAFLGASFATRGRKHLAIDVVGRLLPERGRRVVVAIAATLGSVVALGLSKGVYDALIHQAHDAAEQLRQLQSSGAQNAAVDRTYEFHFVIPGGFLLIALRLLLHGFHEFVSAARNDRAAPPPGAPKGSSDEAEAAAHGESADPAAVEAHRHAPISEAGPIEVGIAIVALLALLGLAVGTTVMPYLGTAVFLAILTLGIPLALRFSKTKSWAPTAPREPEPEVKFTAPHLAAGLVGVVAVLALAKVGHANISHFSIGMGVAFFALMALLGAPLFTFLGVWRCFSGCTARPTSSPSRSRTPSKTRSGRTSRA